MMYKFTVPGPPKGKGRPRVTRRGTFTPKDTVMYEKLVNHSCNIERPLEGMIEATIIAYYPIPKNTSKKNREKMIKGIIRPTKKPDVDNIGKVILDSLNKTAYHDDKQAVDLIVRKFYGETSRVEVVLKELSEMDIQFTLGGLNMTKKELAERILDDLIDEGMIALECGEAYWQDGKAECIDVIYDRLKDFYIIEGRELEN